MTNNLTPNGADAPPLPLSLLDGPALLMVRGSAVTRNEVRTAWVLRCLSSPDGLCNCPGMPERRQRLKQQQRRAVKARRRRTSQRWRAVLIVWATLAGLRTFEAFRPPPATPPHTPAAVYRLDRG